MYNTDLTLITIRHYTQDAINKVIAIMKIIIKEISRNTARFVIRSSIIFNFFRLKFYVLL